MTYALKITDNFFGICIIQFDGENPQQAIENAQTFYKDEFNAGDDLYILEVNEVKGNCFTASADMMIDGVNSPLGEFMLVHAEVRGYGKLTGRRLAHAWCEDDVFVYDFSCGKSQIIPKGIYYATGEVRCMDPEKYRRYTADEMADNLIAFDHYGPWHITTEL